MAPNDSDLIGSHRLAWVDLESSASIDVAVGPTPDYGASLDARNAAVAAALPRDGSAPDGLRNSSQLYLATVVVDNESGLMRSFPAIYLWNQNRAAASSGGAARVHRSNFAPSWTNAQLAPLTIPPVTE